MITDNFSNNIDDDFSEDAELDYSKVLENIEDTEVNVEGVVNILTLSGELDFGCIQCGDTGVNSKGEPCTEPGCIGKYDNREKETLIRDSEYSRLPYPVPLKYRDKTWSAEKALENPPTISSTIMTYKNFVTLLDRILTRAKDNTLLLDSILIASEPKTSKKIWAYTLCKTLKQNNVTVGGIEYLDDIYMNNIMKNQMMIICVTRYEFKKNMDKLDHIISKRKSKDMATIVITDIASRYFNSELDNRPIHFDICIDFANNSYSK